MVRPNDGPSDCSSILPNTSIPQADFNPFPSAEYRRTPANTRGNSRRSGKKRRRLNVVTRLINPAGRLHI